MCREVLRKNDVAHYWDLAYRSTINNDKPLADDDDEEEEEEDGPQLIGLGDTVLSHANLDLEGDDEFMNPPNLLC